MGASTIKLPPFLFWGEIKLPFQGEKKPPEKMEEWRKNRRRAEGKGSEEDVDGRYKLTRNSCGKSA